MFREGALESLLGHLTDEGLAQVFTLLYREQDKRLRERVSKIPSSPELCPEERELLRLGKKIDACKHYQARNHTDLATALRAIDASGVKPAK